MPAYKVSLNFTCQSEGCPRQARWEVFGADNVSRGRYCTSHADLLVQVTNRTLPKNMPEPQDPFDPIPPKV